MAAPVEKNLAVGVNVALIQKTMRVGVCTIFHGYGAMRGTPAGRQLASGSSFDMRSLASFAAQG